MVVALKPLHDAARIRHIVVSTYQAASGKGHAAVEELLDQTRAPPPASRTSPRSSPARWRMNVLMDWKAGRRDDYSEEELKMVNETRKILGDADRSASPPPRCACPW